MPTRRVSRVLIKNVDFATLPNLENSVSSYLSDMPTEAIVILVSRFGFLFGFGDSRGSWSLPGLMEPSGAHGADTPRSGSACVSVKMVKNALFFAVVWAPGLRLLELGRLLGTREARWNARAQ